ncbi:hypothetical protein DXG03_003698 [Asterophora parasitica]|uniref:Protein kinase domain-containing protein n=1 Tax=Asterophora parasitica TaxID=117018 RepID=A0A9P7GFI8_9AGAR|nr:hypothetical protein DXG03_003698 [Asterophora parasitica]
MSPVSSSPPKAPPIKYTAPLGTRWEKETAAAGGVGAFDLPTDPKTIGPWILGECVGKGASGRVKIAKHRLTGQHAAVKILPVAPLVSSRQSLATQQAKSDKMRLGIDKEITMMKLMNHPNIMRIYDVYEGDKELFLVLEYVEGGELFDFLVNRGRLPPTEALAYFKQIIYGLNYAHTFSIIHRDLKPENILIASITPPLIKIADWGMAAFAHPSLQLETSCGSPHYASPEIVNGQSYKGNATDIWSCGVILYALLTGRLPFDDKNVRALLGKVKTGRYDMPTWIDPLAKDLLAKMLMVDVDKRIKVGVVTSTRQRFDLNSMKIPEILAHPWLHSSASTPTSAEQQAAELAITQMPPSPSTLARPIASPELIDPELLASLRVIWGRHADPNGDVIKQDLCSPAGQGVHAKAFYFLLARYREESLRNMEENGDSIDDKLDIRSMKFNLGWELDMSTVNKKYQGHRSSVLAIEAPANSRARALTSTPVSGLSAPVAPVVRRAGSIAASSRERASCPAGPRALPNVTGRPGMDLWRAQASVLDDRKLKASINSPTPTMASGIGRGGPRPTPTRRGYTYSHPDKTASSIQFPQQLHAQDILDQQRPRTSMGASSAQRASMFVLSPNPSRDQPELPMAAIPSPTSSPPPTIYAPVPIPSPKLDVVAEFLFEVDHAIAKELSAMEIDKIVPPPRVPSPDPRAAAALSGQSRVSMTWNPTSEPEKRVISQTQTTQVPLHMQTQAQERDDKENRAMSDESWSYVDAEEPKVHGLGLGVGRDMANVINNAVSVRETTTKKDKKDKKSGPPTLDFRNLKQQKRSTMFGSPISMNSPIIPHTSAGRLLTSPVVGEFKGWFSNLFNWKSHASSQGGILYSLDDVYRTRADVGGMLEGLGVVVEGSGFDRGMSPIDYAAPLKCRIEDPSGSRTPFTLKPVRFRIEFFVAPAVAQDTTTTTNSNYSSPMGMQPQPYNPDLLSAAAGVGAVPIQKSRNSILLKSPVSSSPQCFALDEFPRGSLCAIFMAYEKGSVSSFRVVWRKLKEVYGNGAVAGVGAYPICSPAMMSTPVADHPERFAV